MRPGPEPMPVSTAPTGRLAGWRALLGLLWRAAGWRVAAFGALVLAAGLLPTAVILLTGILVDTLPGAVQHGLDGAGGRPALLALGGLAATMAAMMLAANAMGYLRAVLDAAYTVEVHQAVAAVTLGTPGLAPLETPAFADELDAVQEAERRGVLRQTTMHLYIVATARLRGLGAFAVLLGFAWWAPLLLLATWQLSNRVFLKTIEKGLSAAMNDGAAQQRRSEYLRSVVHEPAAAKEIRVFGLAGWVVGGYSAASREALGLLWRSRSASRGSTAAAAAGLLAAHAAVLGALALAAGRGELGAAALLVFVQAVIATSDLGLVGDSQWWLARSLAVAQRVAGLRARFGTAPPARHGAGEAAHGPAGVRLENVRFTYPARTRPTLDGLTLDIPPGQSLAIVGENGAGKSTLIKLLCGMYEPDAGRITLDGAPPLQARGRIGVIFQDFVRYRLPLRENVGFGNLSLLHDTDALEKALRDAGGAALLDVLPGGWDTPLSREFEGGADLSGGQWQRVALARALAAVRGGAGVLILDEPTASLDVRAETELFERFLEVTRGVTTILVSHRLSSVRHVDRIVVVDGGAVVEDGSHDALMRAGGRYAVMFSLQADRFADQDAHAGEEVAHA
jgi:ATP-binding cassette subfamily B protein